MRMSELMLMPILVLRLEDYVYQALRMQSVPNVKKCMHQSRPFNCYRLSTLCCILAIQSLFACHAAQVRMSVFVPLARLKRINGSVIDSVTKPGTHNRKLPKSQLPCRKKKEAAAAPRLNRCYVILVRHIACHLLQTGFNTAVTALSSSRIQQLLLQECV